MMKPQDSNDKSFDSKTRIKGVGQIAAGVAVAAVGIPMTILPGPGAAAIAGGAILAARGYENATGKKPPVDVDAAVFTASGKMRDITEERVVPAVKPVATTLGVAAATGASAVGAVASQGMKAAAKAISKGADIAERVSENRR